MTRINVVPVEELCDQHLLAEWRELPRMNGFADKCVDASIPGEYVLGAGHMKFFLDKAQFLERRHMELTAELERRGFNLNIKTKFVMTSKHGSADYSPTPEALSINRARIQERMPANARWPTNKRI